MTTGFKINSSKDDAAGYSIAGKMKVKQSSLNIAENNTKIGQSMVQTANSTLDLITMHLQRIRDLSVQAANGTYAIDSRKAIQAEINQRQNEIQRLINSTEYNGIKLFTASNLSGVFISEVEQMSEQEAIADGYKIIRTKNDLKDMDNHLGDKFILMNDIDLEGEIWDPIGNEDTLELFTGELNGNGYVIKNLYCDTSHITNGLFVGTAGATVKNLGIVNANINGGNVGILAGGCLASNIENCYVTGSVNGAYNGGGLCAGINGTTIKNCYVDANVNATYAFGISSSSNLYGEYGSSRISGSYVKGTINGERESLGFSMVYQDTSLNIESSYFNGTLLGNNICDPIGSIDDVGTLTTTNVYYTNGTSNLANTTKITPIELSNLIKHDILPIAKQHYSIDDISLQIGINSSKNSTISFNTSFLCNLSINVENEHSAHNSISEIDEIISEVMAKQTELGAIQNRLDSIIEQIDVKFTNITSSISTIKDADIAKISSEYISKQILEQASATLLSTANQSPIFALELI